MKSANSFWLKEKTSSSSAMAYTPGPGATLMRSLNDQPVRPSLLFSPSQQPVQSGWGSPISQTPQDKQRAIFMAARMALRQWQPVCLQSRLLRSSFPLSKTALAATTLGVIEASLTSPGTSSRQPRRLVRTTSALMEAPAVRCVSAVFLRFMRNGKPSAHRPRPQPSAP